MRANVSAREGGRGPSSATLIRGDELSLFGDLLRDSSQRDALGNDPVVGGRVTSARVGGGVAVSTHAFVEGIVGRLYPS